MVMDKAMMLMLMGLLMIHPCMRIAHILVILSTLNRQVLPSINLCRKGYFENLNLRFINYPSAWFQFVTSNLIGVREIEECGKVSNFLLRLFCIGTFGLRLKVFKT